jgi:ABC-type lipoprotein export system ATPase subunit
VLALMRTLNRAEGHTFLIVTHDAEVGAVCDRTILMRDGCIVAGGHRATAS